MEILVCNVDLFSHGQFVYTVDSEGNKMNELGVFTLDSLGENMAQYCEVHDIRNIKLFGNKEYLNHTVVPDINKYAFHNYSKDFKVNIEVIDR